MKEYGTLSPVCRVLAHYLKTALNSIFLRILGRLKANANREQNLPSLLEQLCRDAALLIQKKKRSATSPTHPLCIT